MELQNINRLAVFKLRHIGDVLVMTPALRALRETFPQARITAVVNSGTEAMLAHNPHIDEVLVLRRPENEPNPWKRLRYELQFVGQLRRRQFDLTIGFTDGDRTSWYTRFCGARYRVGAAHYTRGKYDPRRRIYNMPAPSSAPPMHEVERHFYILEQAGLELRSTKPGKLCLVIPDDLRAWAAKELEPLRPAQIIHIHPVSHWLWKCWGDAAMAQVIDWLQTERRARVVLTTGPMPREREKAQKIIRLCRTQPLFYDGNLSLGQTAAISAASDGYFGVDTAPMHMAAAVDVPVIALFGPTGSVSWRPWTPLAHVLSQPCVCHGKPTPPCSWDADKVRHCLATISVAQAQAALDEVLATPKTP